MCSGFSAGFTHFKKTHDPSASYVDLHSVPFFDEMNELSDLWVLGADLN
jgi:hypothetical protein